ncbi:MAG TPA: U32 family peptidase [Flavobacteriales bacterium]|nr:U32 family peptidase [Flavobacteriales bacterium]HIN39904.1 U32 family peptidase [Flavobacteriales bacterium]
MMELMSPVGSFEALHAAIKGGCDSVYLGVGQLNMRAVASNNFKVEDLEKIAEICKKAKIKSYITLNTILYDHDMNLMKQIVNECKKQHISAIIASDPAAMAYIKKTGVPLHISTQANITNIETVNYYALFADVMVMARELTLQQVKQITTQIKKDNITGPLGNLIEVEIFGHGALCMAVSGKCYLSLHSHNSSANRGACIQNCRREYNVTDKEGDVDLLIDNEYIMSAKDLCTIGFLDEIINAGVKVLKIEGRGKAADYVFTTTKCYREAIDSITDKTYCVDKIKAWEEKLASVFNRGFWDGYYLGRKMGEWSKDYGSIATKRKVYIGRGKKYFKNIKIGEFEMETHSLNVGDEIMITGPSTGIIESTISELRVNDKTVKKVNKGDLFSFPIDEVVRPSDKLYKLVDNKI